MIVVKRRELYELFKILFKQKTFKSFFYLN